MKNVSVILQRWGAWVRQYPESPFYRVPACRYQYPSKTDKVVLPCSEENAALIIRVMTQFSRVCPEQTMETLLLHYVSGYSKSALARRRKCSEGRIRQEMQVAEGFIEGGLSLIGGILMMTDVTTDPDLPVNITPADCGDTIPLYQG